MGFFKKDKMQCARIIDCSFFNILPWFNIYTLLKNIFSPIFLTLSGTIAQLYVCLLGKGSCKNFLLHNVVLNYKKIKLIIKIKWYKLKFANEMAVAAPNNRGECIE